MVTVRAHVTLDPGRGPRPPLDRNGPVGRVMGRVRRAGDGRVQGGRRGAYDPADRRHIELIESTTVGSPQGVKVVTSSIHYGGAPKKATAAHEIRPRRAKVLRSPPQTAASYSPTMSSIQAPRRATSSATASDALAAGSTVSPADLYELPVRRQSAGLQDRKRKFESFRPCSH